MSGAPVPGEPWRTRPDDHDARVTTPPSRQVYDKKFQSTVTAEVEVTVRLLPREAVTQSGSLRIAGVSAEQFVTDVDKNVS